VAQGLWRVDNNDICRLANSKSPKKDGGSSSTAEEGRGPHVALAIRLKRRDPDREFHIGERIQYVLVKNSSKMQVQVFGCENSQKMVDAITG
jgi:DNA polymerase elongation subunit (family B)